MNRRLGGTHQQHRFVSIHSTGSSFGTSYGYQHTPPTSSQQWHDCRRRQMVEFKKKDSSSSLEQDSILLSEPRETDMKNKRQLSPPKNKINRIVSSSRSRSRSPSRPQVVSRNKILPLQRSGNKNIQKSMRDATLTSKTIKSVSRKKEGMKRQSGPDSSPSEDSSSDESKRETRSCCKSRRRVRGNHSEKVVRSQSLSDTSLRRFRNNSRRRNRTYSSEDSEEEERSKAGNQHRHRRFVKKVRKRHSKQGKTLSEMLLTGLVSCLDYTLDTIEHELDIEEEMQTINDDVAWFASLW